MSEFVSAQTVVLCRDAQTGEPVIFEVDLGHGMVVSNDSGKAVLQLTAPEAAEISSLGFYSEYLTLKPDTSYVFYLTSVAIGLRKVVVSDVHGNREVLLLSKERRIDYRGIL